MRQRNGLVMVLIASALMTPAWLQLAAQTAAPQGPVIRPAIEVPGSTEELVFEPVFKGEALIYRAGPRRGPTVVLVHGVGDNGVNDYTDLIEALAPHYRVLAFDLPGFGRSAKQNVLYNPAMYAMFVRWAVDRYVDGPYDLIGHSLGGAIALRYAATFPGEMERLILVDVAGVLHEVAISEHMMQNFVNDKLRMPDDGPQAALLRIFSARAVAKLQRLPIDLGIPLGGETAREKMLRSNPTAIASLSLVSEDYTLLLDQVETPTLILWGVNDEITPLRTGKALAAQIPNARLVTIPNSGHVPMRDNPDFLHRRVLAELSSPPRFADASQDLSSSFDPVGKIGRCEGERGVVFVGDYERIEIINCNGAKVLDARSRSMSVVGSYVEMEGSRISGSDVALEIRDSTMVVTASSFEGKVAIAAEESRLDLAGVEVKGEEAGVQSASKAVVVASVSRIESPHHNGSLHGYHDVSPENPL